MRTRSVIAIAAASVALFAACSSSDEGGTSTTTVAASSATTSGSTTTGPAKDAPLRILVTNDDGVGADGIDALVEALRELPDTTVTVVAPAKNQSGTGSNVTAGALEVNDAETASGYAAKAVNGFPADTIIWAIDGGGISTRPHVVISGINAGQNLGPLIELSGTVGAAADAAAQRGIPALAASQGLGDPFDYPSGVKAVLAWLAENRAQLAARDTASTAPSTVTNLNIPTCPTGTPRAVVVAPIAGADSKPLDPVDCVAPYSAPTSDVDAFLHGFIAQTNNVPITAAAA